MTRVVNDPEAALRGLLTHAATSAEPAAEAASLVDELAGYDAHTDLRLMAALYDEGSERAVGHTLEILKGVSQAIRLRREAALALAESDAAVNDACGNRLAGLARRLREQQMRRRADAVEALYGIDSPELRELFWHLAATPMNRVAANALLGLYRLSDGGVFPALRQMASHPDRRWRASALWAIGKTGDQRFSELLLKYLNDREPALRREALKVLRRIKDNLAQAVRTPGLDVAILGFASTGDSREAWVVALDSKGLQPSLSSTAFVLRDNGSLVEDYQVERIQPAEPVHVAMLAIAAAGRNEGEFLVAQQAIARLIEQKRPEDYAAVIKLRTRESAAGAGALAVSFANKSWLLRRASQQPATVSGPPDDAIGAALRGVLAEIRSRPGPRHILCWFGSLGDAPVDVDPIIGEAVLARVQVHVIAAKNSDHPAAFLRLAEATGGGLLRTASTAALRNAFATLYEGIVAGYRLTWTAVVPTQALTLRVFNGAAAGAALWPQAGTSDAAGNAPAAVR